MGKERELYQIISKLLPFVEQGFYCDAYGEDYNDAVDAYNEAMEILRIANKKPLG